MKGFLISMLAVGTALLLAALLWPDRSPPASERQRQIRPIAAAIDSKDVELVQEYHAVPAIPSRSAVSIDRPPAMSYRESTDEVPSAGPMSNKPTKEPIAKKPITPHDSSGDLGDRLTLKQTAPSDTSLRNSDFPRTYISSIQVDLTSPNHWVRLTWTGPQAASQETGPFHSSPGRGRGNNNCDNVAESNGPDSNCTPKGTWHVQAFSETMATGPECRFVTWFQVARGVAIHYYPSVPNYPASHGCVRLRDMHAAQLIHNNSKLGATEVIVAGKWTLGR